jgi:hypothetical protein
MQNMYYIGLDVHKRAISYCVKDVSGRIYAEGSVPARRIHLDHWMRTLPQPWTAAMEATVFTGWIYDYLQPHAAGLKVTHPLMLRAIAAAKKIWNRNRPRGQDTRRGIRKNLHTRSPEARQGALLPLDKTYHRTFAVNFR